MTPKTKSVLLQVVLAMALLGVGALLAVLGMRPPCCDPKSDPYAACASRPTAESGRPAADGKPAQGNRLPSTEGE